MPYRPKYELCPLRETLDIHNSIRLTRESMRRDAQEYIRYYKVRWPIVLDQNNMREFKIFT
jgi:hypothetical protein